MIILDTHIWVWWVHDDPQLLKTHRDYIQTQESNGLGINVITCWEVAKLVEVGRLTLPVPVLLWLQQALAYPGIHLIELTPEIVVESTQLPDNFHRDPADQIIVATSHIYTCPLVTLDKRIRAYTRSDCSLKKQTMVPCI